MKVRTKAFALRAIRLFRALPRTEEARVIGRQLLRSATSVAANYRASCRARSKTEFAAKLGVVVEEADETVFWIELLGDAEIVPAHRLEELKKEADELVAIFFSARRSVLASCSRTEKQ
jgi:four helix bundle protein